MIIEVLDPEIHRRIHAVLAGHDAGGTKPNYKKDTVIKHFNSGYMVRSPGRDPLFYRDEEVRVMPEISHEQ